MKQVAGKTETRLWISRYNETKKKFGDKTRIQRDETRHSNKDVNESWRNEQTREIKKFRKQILTRRKIQIFIAFYSSWLDFCLGWVSHAYLNTTNVRTRREREVHATILVSYSIAILVSRILATILFVRSRHNEWNIDTNEDIQRRHV